MAERLLEVDPHLLPTLLDLVGPFVERVRRGFIEEGWLTFDGLLARARALLRDHPEIRERLKQEYRSLLVDEFQDTDPVQYEIVLYLCERQGRRASSWRDTELEPGKLFIVGDPKQSIYAFRRADIEAFDHVVSRLEREGALVCTLATNFRSDVQVLDVVNGVFDKLLVAQASVQPGNVPLAVQPNRASQFPDPGVRLRFIAGGEEESDLDAAGATRAEAELVAAWLARLLPVKTRDGASPPERSLRPGQTALLFRKLTQAEVYLQALHRHGIRYIIDGEKHFYRRQEIIDLVNLLRCLENPHDQIACAGLLRSPLGGLSDPELVALQRLDALDFRRAERLAQWEAPSAPTVRRLYAVLAELHAGSADVPLPELLDRIFARLPILELAAASLHEEQAVANLLKLRQMAVELADRPALSLSGFVELMMARLVEQPDEAESALSEETLDAVRVMTIHKAKGLEFPLVVLAGLHHGDGASRGYAGPVIRHDWSTGIQGLEFGTRCSLGSVLVAEKARTREQAERRRLLYVGMTRAKDCLVLSGAVGRKRSRDTFMDLLQQAFGQGFGDQRATQVAIAGVSVPQVVAPGEEPDSPRQAARPTRLEAFPEGAVLSSRWAQRDRDWAACRSMARSLSPSRLMQANPPQGFSGGAPVTGVVGGAHVGRLVHQALQHWDFAADVEEQLSKLRTAGFDRGDSGEYLGQDDVDREVRDLLRRFAGGDFYARLRRAEILGREVPFFLPWNEGRQVMEGVIDLVYRLDGALWIADYKTDMIPADQVAERAQAYREQARIYSEAVSRSLREPVAGFEFVFLRHGLSVSVVP
ncbi:MAG: 3'-5' exonuclease [Nitrospiraceae bacterium]